MNFCFLKENVTKFDMDGKEYNGKIFSLLAIDKKVQNLTDFQTWEKSLPDKSDISTEQISRGKRFGQFALRTYKASLETDSQKVADKMGVEQEDVLTPGSRMMVKVFVQGLLSLLIMIACLSSWPYGEHFP